MKYDVKNKAERRRSIGLLNCVEIKQLKLITSVLITYIYIYIKIIVITKQKSMIDTPMRKESKCDTFDINQNTREGLLMCPLPIYTSSLEKCLLRFYAYILIEVFFLY